MDVLTSIRILRQAHQMHAFDPALRAFGDGFGYGKRETLEAGWRECACEGLSEGLSVGFCRTMSILRFSTGNPYILFHPVSLAHLEL